MRVAPDSSPIRIPGEAPEVSRLWLEPPVPVPQPFVRKDGTP